MDAGQGRALAKMVVDEATQWIAAGRPGDIPGLYEMVVRKLADEQFAMKKDPFAYAAFVKALAKTSVPENAEQKTLKDLTDFMASLEASLAFDAEKLRRAIAQMEELDFAADEVLEHLDEGVFVGLVNRIKLSDLTHGAFVEKMRKKHAKLDADAKASTDRLARTPVLLSGIILCKIYGKLENRSRKGSQRWMVTGNFLTSRGLQEQLVRMLRSCHGLRCHPPSDHTHKEKYFLVGSSQKFYALYKRRYG